MGGPGWLGGEPREALGGWARAPEGGRSLGGGGLLPARGTTGAPLVRGGGGGRVSPGVGPCRFMAAQMGLYPQPSAPESLFFGGAEGGGGWRLSRAPTHAGGARRWELRPAWPKIPGGVPWARGPLRGRTSDSPGGTPLYGMVWYGMVWYGMVWYGMVWYGIVWYAMVWYGMVWYVVIVVVRAPSTCRREKLPDTLSLGRAQGSSRRASRWPGVCRQRPRGGGVRPSVRGGEGARVAVRGSTCPCDPGFLPRRGGRACAPVRNGGGIEGGMEGPLVRGPAGPRFPLLPAATPPRHGRGLRPVRRGSKGVEGAGTMYGLSPGARPCDPCAGGRAARPAGGSRTGPGAWVAAGG